MAQVQPMHYGPFISGAVLPPHCIPGSGQGRDVGRPHPIMTQAQPQYLAQPQHYQQHGQQFQQLPMGPVSPSPPHGMAYGQQCVSPGQGGGPSGPIPTRAAIPQVHPYYSYSSSPPPGLAHGQECVSPGQVEPRATRAANDPKAMECFERCVIESGHGFDPETTRKQCGNLCNLQISPGHGGQNDPTARECFEKCVTGSGQGFDPWTTREQCGNLCNFQIKGPAPTRAAAMPRRQDCVPGGETSSRQPRKTKSGSRQKSPKEPKETSPKRAKETSPKRAKETRSAPREKSRGKEKSPESHRTRAADKSEAGRIRQTEEKFCKATGNRDKICKGNRDWMDPESRVSEVEDAFCRHVHEKGLRTACDGMCSGKKSGRPKQPKQPGVTRARAPKKTRDTGSQEWDPTRKGGQGGETGSSTSTFDGTSKTKPTKKDSWDAIIKHNPDETPSQVWNPHTVEPDPIKNPSQYWDPVRLSLECAYLKKFIDIICKQGDQTIISDLGIDCTSLTMTPTNPMPKQKMPPIERLPGIEQQICQLWGAEYGTCDITGKTIDQRIHNVEQALCKRYITQLNGVCPFFHTVTPEEMSCLVECIKTRLADSSKPVTKYTDILTVITDCSKKCMKSPVPPPFIPPYKGPDVTPQQLRCYTDCLTSSTNVKTWEEFLINMDACALKCGLIVGGGITIKELICLMECLRAAAADQTNPITTHEQLASIVVNCAAKCITHSDKPIVIPGNIEWIVQCLEKKLTLHIDADEQQVLKFLEDCAEEAQQNNPTGPITPQEIACILDCFEKKLKDKSKPITNNDELVKAYTECSKQCYKYVPGTVTPFEKCLKSCISKKMKENPKGNALQIAMDCIGQCQITPAELTCLANCLNTALNNANPPVTDKTEVQKYFADCVKKCCKNMPDVPISDPKVVGPISPDQLKCFQACFTKEVQNPGVTTFPQVQEIKYKCLDKCTKDHMTPEELTCLANCLDTALNNANPPVTDKKEVQKYFSECATKCCKNIPVVPSYDPHVIGPITPDQLKCFIKCFTNELKSPNVLSFDQVQQIKLDCLTKCTTIDPKELLCFASCLKTFLDNPTTKDYSDVSKYMIDCASKCFKSVPKIDPHSIPSGPLSPEAIKCLEDCFLRSIFDPSISGIPEVIKRFLDCVKDCKRYFGG